MHGRVSIVQYSISKPRERGPRILGLVDLVELQRTNKNQPVVVTRTGADERQMSCNLTRPQYMHTQSDLPVPLSF